MSILHFKRFVGIVLLTFVVAGCYSESQNSSPVLRGDMITFENAGNFFSINEVQEVFENGTLGNTVTSAVVPLVFDTTGNLLTAKEFNNRVNTSSLKDTTTHFTDFSTFKTVMLEMSQQGLQTQSRIFTIAEKYIFTLSVPTTGNLATESTDETVAYAYDPYQSIYETPEEIETAYLAKVKRDRQIGKASTLSTASHYNSTNYVWVGDIAYSNQSSSQSGVSGHSGVVTTLNTGGLTGGNNKNSGTRTTEAVGSRSNNVDVR